MSITVLKDKDINISNFANFKKCHINDDGKHITFVMACGHIYYVALVYFIRWFSNPHYVQIKGKLAAWKKANCQADDGRAKFKKCRRILSNKAIRVYLTNGFVYDVPWDTVLMACEKKYEHFGGLTSTSKQIVNDWHTKTENS